MSEHTRRLRRAAGAVLGAGLVVVLASGCNLEVFNPGAITDEALNDPSLMDVVAAGVANEFNQLPDANALDMLRLTDQAAGNGSYFGTGELRRGVLNWDDTGGRWGQVHETIWTGLAAWYRMSSIEGYDQENQTDAARVWLLIGFAHRTYGETFCDAIYSVGAEFTEPVEGSLVPRTATFDSAIVAFQKAIDIATRTGDDDIVTAARAGIAQAYVGKDDFTSAITWSSQVPTDFSWDALYNQNSNGNTVWVQTQGRNEVGLFNSYAFNLATMDPRVPYTVCGTFDDPTDPFNATVIPTGNCNSENGADGVTAHIMQEKYPDEGSDIPVAKGTEMRLIEAEAALLAGDLTTFTARINDVRAHHDLDPIAEPAAAGALEYENSPTAPSPFERVLHNAYDASTGNVGDPGVDGWSILDGERHLTMWGEGRRLFDLHRWNHPFLDGGLVFWDTEARRVSCFPVPEIECTLNDALNGATLQTGVGSATRTCNN